MAESKEKIAAGEIDVKSYYDFTDESEYQALLDSRSSVTDSVKRRATGNP